MNYFDLHCDTPYECYSRAIPFSDKTLAVSSDKGIIFDKWTQCFAIWIKDGISEPFTLYNSILKDFNSKLLEAPSNLEPILTVEGGALIEKDLSRVEKLHNDGIRVLTLTWNGQNSIAGGVDTDASLSDFGIKVINELNRFNMLCDLSHLNRKSFFNALEHTAHPIITHCCCSAVKKHKRNLDDEQLLAVLNRGALIGLCFYPEFVGEDVYDGIYRNIFHICDMGFEDNIAIGSDFDGAKMQRCLSGVDNVPQLFEYLYRKGLQKELLNKIFYNNAEKIFVSL